MQQTSTQKNQASNLSLDVEKYPLVELSRKFAAPVERLWKAWTTPEHIKEWWGPEAYSCPEAFLDVRKGGKSILAMQAPDGNIQYSGGVYQDVIPNKKLVSTDQFMDKNGKPMSANKAGMPGDWPEEGLVTINFTSLSENESQLDIVHQGIPKAMHDDCVGGWSSSLNKLQKLVERT